MGILAMALDLMEDLVFHFLVADLVKIIFRVDMSSSPHTDNKKRYVNSWKGTNTGFRTYTNCRKNVFY